MLNSMALEVLFGEAMPLGWLPTDPESNLDNYWEGKLVKEDPLEVPIFEGAQDYPHKESQQADWLREWNGCHSARNGGQQC